jgi:hypothetical protein
MGAAEMLAATKPPTLPDFATPEERAKYIKEHAEFFTVISRKHLRNLRLEYESTIHVRCVNKAVLHEMLTQPRAKSRALDAYNRAEVDFLALVGKLTTEE